MSSNVSNTAPPGNEGASAKPRMLVDVAEFFEAVDCQHPEAHHGVVWLGSGGKPNDHQWPPQGADFAAWASEKINGRTAYITVGAFPHGTVSRFEGRKAAHVAALKSLVVDIDAGPDKHAKNPGHTYPDGKAAGVAFKEVLQAGALPVPSYMVPTGSGGLHLWFVLDEAVAPDRWAVLARALVRHCQSLGLKIDAQCTTDAARIMRAPGSSRSGEVIRCFALREGQYTYDELASLLGCDESNEVPASVSRPPQRSGINAEVIESTHAPYSYKQAAEKCGAMRSAAQHGGREAQYPVWVLALGAAKCSTEGRDFAHEISTGHPDYDEAQVDAKLDSLTGGPANCEAWAAAYGRGGPCDSCEFRGTIKNPIRLGRPEVTASLAQVGSQAEVAPQWVQELNERYAVLRHGADVVIADARTPVVSGNEVRHVLGFLSVSAFRQTLAGRFAPTKKAGDRPQPLADAWLRNLQRRQYDGLVFAPGIDTPPQVLNVWQGFAVEPVAGDVAPWVRVLDAVVTGPVDRAYVLKWLAWKVQNPGGVPDTTVIVKGAKGTGKNSLFDPIVALFGRHAMIAADPELIVGRFTFHLLSMAFVVMDEAVFTGDPRHMDRIKTRVTGKTLHYEQKGMDPVQGQNRCAYVMLTNHTHVWDSSGADERRAVVIESGTELRGDLAFWEAYHEWASGPGPAHLLHHLQQVDLTGWNPRRIPRGEALRKQTELTALRNPVVSWWFTVLSEGARRSREGGMDRVTVLNEDAPTEVQRDWLRLSYEASAGARTRGAADWALASKKIKEWAARAGHIRQIQKRTGHVRARVDVLPSLRALRAAFTQATQVQFDEDTPDES